MLLAAAEARSVRACVDALEGGQKQAIALAFYQGLTHAEVAHHLRQPLGTIQVVGPARARAPERVPRPRRIRPVTGPP